MSLVISECVDFDLICEMDSKTFPEEDRITSSEYTQWFYDGNKIYSLKDDENLVGYIQLNGRYITGICVLPEYGKKGYATYMLEHILRKYDTLYCKIRKVNLASQRLFEKNGFERVGERGDWYWYAFYGKE